MRDAPLCTTAREDLKALNNTYDKTESDLRALHSVGQIVGEILKQLDSEKCKAVNLTDAVKFNNDHPIDE